MLGGISWSPAWNNQMEGLLLQGFLGGAVEGSEKFSKVIGGLQSYQTDRSNI